MKKTWNVIKFILGGSIGIPNFMAFWGLAFATYGFIKPVGIFFGILAIISTIFSVTWYAIDAKNDKKLKK